MQTGGAAYAGQQLAGNNPNEQEVIAIAVDTLDLDGNTIPTRVVLSGNDHPYQGRYWY